MLAFQPPGHILVGALYLNEAPGADFRRPHSIECHYAGDPGRAVFFTNLSSEDAEGWPLRQQVRSHLAGGRRRRTPEIFLQKLLRKRSDTRKKKRRRHRCEIYCEERQRRAIDR